MPRSRNAYSLVLLSAFACACATTGGAPAPAATPEPAAAPVSAAVATTPASAEPAAAEPAAVEGDREQALLKQHTEIWNLMELSPDAQKELNGIVAAVHKQMAKNKKERPEEMARLSEVKRATKPTFEEYMANHKRRFDALKISAPTQEELLAASEFTWNALHDPDVPADKRKAAETIRSMMHSMNGPPPCCDDNIFERAKP